jgi:hypothetical protein
MGRLIAVFAAVASVLFLARPAEARDEAECQMKWSQAVRSYLTTNRKAAPDGTVANDLDGKELADQAWLAAFKPACQLEANGDRSSARIEAATIAVQILAKLDGRGCQRFMQYYMDSARGKDVCSAGTTADSASLREQVASSIPKR